MSDYSDWKKRSEDRKRERVEKGEGSGNPQKQGAANPLRVPSDDSSWLTNREEARKRRNKERLRKVIQDLYGPIPESLKI